MRLNCSEKGDAMTAEPLKRCRWIKSIIAALVLLSFFLPMSSMAQSGLSLAGIELLQSLPFEKQVALSSKQSKTVLEGIFNLVVKQHGLDTEEARRKYPEYQKSMNGDYKEGELGWILRKIFLFGLYPDTKDVFGIDAYREKQISPDADNFRLRLGPEDIYLSLDKTFGNLNNLPWGVEDIRRKRQLAGDQGLKEEFVFAFHDDNKTTSVFRLIRNRSGDIIKEELIAIFTKGDPLPKSP